MNSSELLRRAKRVIPGGVNSPVRAFRGVGGDPPFIQRGEGGHLWDVEGKRYLDLVCGWGPLILGHAPAPVVERLASAAAEGTCLGACTEREVRFAEKLVALVPGVEKVRLVSSGTEATMSALRLARGFTGRNLIIKAVGGYHGHADCLLVRAGSGAQTLGVPDSAGVPPGTVADTLLVPYNDSEAIATALNRHAGEVAAVIVEPVAGNMGVVPPQDGYLEAIRAATEEAGALLVFDEVITGFRLGLGGAQGHYGVIPDITCLGKIIGGGLPVGAYGGKGEIMDRVAPDGPVYQAGTLSGNPLALAAGMATLEVLEKAPPYTHLDRLAADLTAEVAAASARRNVPLHINRVGSMFTLFFTERTKVVDLDGAKSCDVARYGQFHRAALDRGLYLPPSQFEACFLCTAHTEEDLVGAAKGLDEALGAIA